VLRLVRYELSRHSVKLVEEYGALPLVWADANKLKQVFINLVMNASQVMPKGGTLTIRTGVTHEGHIEALVADTGNGIPAAIREQIFEPFFSTKKEGEGTGLGLYICRNIMVDSAEGKGSVFRVLLPLAELMT
jgi:signal transduction histidine kinase